MPDYQRGKIYKITSGDLTYIGSTCEPTLAKRLANHVSHYKFWLNGKRAHYTCIPLIATGQYEITLIELYPCNSKDELTARERFHIETNECVNKVHPGRSKKERYEDTKEIVLEQRKAYYEANKDTIIERRKAYYDANHATQYEEKKDKINERRRLRRRQSRKNGQTPSETVSLDCQGQEVETK